MSDILKGLVAGGAWVAALGMIILFWVAGIDWLSHNIQDPFWRTGLMLVGIFSGVGALVGALVSVMDA